MHGVVWASIRGASLIELAATIATANAFYNLVFTAGVRFFSRDEEFRFPDSQFNASILAFVVSAAVLSATMYLRRRYAGDTVGQGPESR